MSFGVDEPEIGRNAAVMVAQILKGAKPADIPIFQPTKFVLAINLKTAKLSFSKPLGVLFLKWIAQNKTKLVSKLKSTVMDHPE